MEIGKCILTGNLCYQRNVEQADSRYTEFQNRGPLGVMLHSTGANNPQLRRYLAPDDGIIGKNQYDNDWNRAGIAKCVHAMIGKDRDGIVRTYQCLPWNYRGWHCAKSGNDTHVAIEICEDDLTDGLYFAECYAQAVELTAHICAEYGLDPMADGVVIDHAEGYELGVASDHSDVGYWFRKFNASMDGFREDVSRALETADEPEPPAEKATYYAALGEVPEFYRTELDYLISKGYLKGRGGEGDNLILDMTEEGVRLLVVLARRFMEQDGL